MEQDKSGLALRIMDNTFKRENANLKDTITFTTYEA